MDDLWLHWTKNPDYQNLLAHPEVRTANMIKRAEEKRALARKRRQLKKQRK